MELKVKIESSRKYKSIKGNKNIVKLNKQTTTWQDRRPYLRADRHCWGCQES